MKNLSPRTAILTGLSTILLLGIYIAVHQWICWLLQSYPNFSAKLPQIKTNIADLDHLLLIIR